MAWASEVLIPSFADGRMGVARGQVASLGPGGFVCGAASRSVAGSALSAARGSAPGPWEPSCAFISCLRSPLTLLLALLVAAAAGAEVFCTGSAGSWGGFVGGLCWSWWDSAFPNPAGKSAARGVSGQFWHQLQE